MINYLYSLVEKLITFNMYNTILCFISIFLIFIFYNLFNFNFIDYKIKNFKLNSLFILIYFFLFIKYGKI